MTIQKGSSDTAILQLMVDKAVYLYNLENVSVGEDLSDSTDKSYMLALELQSELYAI